MKLRVESRRLAAWVSYRRTLRRRVPLIFLTEPETPAFLIASAALSMWGCGTFNTR